MTAKPRIFDVADHLKTDRQMALYLEACLEEQDPELVIGRWVTSFVRRAFAMWQYAPVCPSTRSARF